MGENPSAVGSLQNGPPPPQPPLFVIRTPPPRPHWRLAKDTDARGEGGGVPQRGGFGAQNVGLIARAGLGSISGRSRVMYVVFASCYGSALDI